MRLADAVTEYEFAIAHLSPRSQEWSRQKLHAFAAWMEEQGLTALEDVTVPLTRRYFDYLRRTPSERTGKPLSTYTLHGYFEVVRTFLYWCVREDLLEDRFGKRLTPPKVEQKVIQTFSPSEIAALFKACERGDTPTLVWRNKAILAVLLDTGVRAAELCGLTLDRVHFTAQDAWILVRGKGNKEREVGLGREARVLLHRYLTRFRKAPEGEPHVFLSRSGEPLTVSKLDGLLYRLRDWAGVSGVRCSAHTFRHTFAVRYLEAGGDLFTLSHLLGHTHISTTMIYTKDYQQRTARTNGLSVLDRMQKPGKQKPGKR